MSASNLSWIVGDVRVTRVEEGVSYVDATALIPAFTTERLDPHREWLTPHFFSDRNDKMALSIHSFVVETEGQVIVVDTCVGPGDRALPGDEGFPDRLAAAIDGGLEAVTHVLCTHLHFDHVGWNLRTVDGELVPTFPNARYLFGAVEVAHTRTDDHMHVLAPSIDPLIDAGLVDLIDVDHIITPEVRLVSTPGHTPGHVSVLIESQGGSALITGDMAHTPLQFADPSLASAAFDFDSEQSTATREQIVETYIETDTLILGTHFAPPTGGHLRRGESGVRLEIPS